MKPVPKPTPAAKLRAAADRKQRKAYDLVYLLVTERDHGACRVCGALYPPLSMHRHHIVYRSAGGPTSLANVLLLCRVCHQDEHEHTIRITGDAHEPDALCVERQYGSRWVRVV